MTPPADEKTPLLTRLDTLLEHYLHTLDEYEQLTQQLSTHLSSAFISLTTANFHNRSGVRYGRDGYDERLKAGRKFVISERETETKGGEKRVEFGIRRTVMDETSDQEAKAESNNPPSQEDEKNEDKEDEKETTPSTPQDTKTAETSLTDPIRMFGILVPPALRTAQTSFVEALEGPVVRLAAVTGELRALEREIGRARKGVRKVGVEG